MVVNLVRLAECALGLVRDLGMGIASKGEIHCFHSHPLRAAEADLIRFGADHPSVQPQVSLLWQYARSSRTGGPQGITLVPLKQAAEAVYDAAKKDIEPGPLAAIEAALVDGTSATTAKLKPEDPRPSAIHQSFHRFTPALQEALREKRGESVSSLDRNPEYLAATVRGWLATTVSPYTDETLDQMDEVFDWLSTTPVTYQHNFVVALVNKPELKEAGMDAVHGWIRFINQRLEKRGERRAWVLETEVTIAQSFKSGYCSQYRFLQVAAGSTLKTGFDEIIANQKLRVLVVAASGAGEAVLFSSEERLKSGLAAALVGLNPLDELEIGADVLQDRLRACVAILELFLGDKPFLDQSWFFHQRLVRAGMDHLTQRALLARVKQAIGVEYKFRKPSVLYRVGDKPVFLTAITEGEQAPVVVISERARLQGAALGLRGVIEALERGEGLKGIHRAHALGLQEMRADLLNLARSFPWVRGAADRVHGFAASVDRQGPNRLLTQLRSDCEALEAVVLQRLDSLVPEAPVTAVVGALTSAGSGGFESFSPALKRALGQLVPKGPTKRLRGRGRTATLEKSPGLLRAVAAEWSRRALVKIDSDLEKLREGTDGVPLEFLLTEGRFFLELMRWLSRIPERSFVDGFFRKVMGDREIQKLGGIDFIRRVLHTLDERLRFGLRLAHQRVAVRKPRKGRVEASNQRTVYFVETEPARTGGVSHSDGGVFHTGDRVVRPGIGVAEVVGVEVREISGQVLPVYVLSHRGSRLMVPVQQAAQTGLRPLVAADQLGEIYQILGQRDRSLNGQSSGEVIKRSVARLRSGGLREVAQVVRDLDFLAQRRQEESMQDILGRALRQLVSEVAFVSGKGEDEVRREVMVLLSSSLSTK